MVVIGIVGGVASGKSLVAAELERLGAFKLDADAIAHRVLREPKIVAAARSRWGLNVIDDTGQIRRASVAAHVFGESPEARIELKYWEACMHPRITQLVQSTLDELRSAGTHSSAVLDAAVMFKAGWDSLCDKIVFVDVPPELRWKRAEKRGWTRKQFLDRERSQLPVEEKRRRSGFVIDNSGSLEQTYGGVLRFWNSLSL